MHGILEDEEETKKRNRKEKREIRKKFIREEATLQTLSLEADIEETNGYYLLSLARTRAPRSNFRRNRRRQACPK